ncbi:hypothetical protein [Aminobacter sp. BE322]|uniref:hypothetical protein n=1 Tax=unclassified Aminobacter TaxID=2644704 RepID=UPI003D24A73D
MGKVKIPYYSVLRKNGRGYWQPTSEMKALGFRPTACGPDGPAAWAKARALNDQWQKSRKTREPAPAPAPPPAASEKVWPARSIGEAFTRYRFTVEWTKKADRTREDWERGWKYIAPVFGNHSPALVTMEVVSEWRESIERDISLREAHRAMKIWRALWKVAAAMKYCRREDDPSLAVQNTEPKGRSAMWREGEAVRLVKRAFRMEYYGLAAALACMWDGSVSPIDARTLTLAQRKQDGDGTWFELSRAKTGRDSVLTLSKRTERLLAWYLQKQFGEAEPISSMEIFRTRRGAAYRKNSFAEDFRDVRKVEFPGDSRMMLDFRRSGSVEAVAGGVEGSVLSAKMGNSLSESKKLEQTYVPVQVEMVRRADDARREGRKRLRKNK